MSRNNDRGTSFENEIKAELESAFHEERFEVATSKGSGNQRHDGDVQIKRKYEGDKPLYIDCKNYESAAVPTRDQIMKAGDQGDRLGFDASVVIMKNKHKEKVVSMRYQDFVFLITAFAHANYSVLHTEPPTKERLLKKLKQP